MLSIFAKSGSCSVPVLIIKKENDEENIKEFDSIEETIADLEKDLNVPPEKIEKLKESIKKLKESIKKLKDRTSIKIRNGEII